MLPPLDDRMYRGLVAAAVAVLDPFPVGMSAQILGALMDGVPVVRHISAPAPLSSIFSLSSPSPSYLSFWVSTEVRVAPCAEHSPDPTPAPDVGRALTLTPSEQVSAPSLQECTNSHVKGLVAGLGLEAEHGVEWPTSPEEYAVMALRLRTDQRLRAQFQRNEASQGESSPTGPGPSHGEQLIEFVRHLTQPVRHLTQPVR